MAINKEEIKQDIEREFVNVDAQRMKVLLEVVLSVMTPEQLANLKDIISRLESGEVIVGDEYISKTKGKTKKI